MKTFGKGECGLVDQVAGFETRTITYLQVLLLLFYFFIIALLIFIIIIVIFIIITL